MDRTAAGKPVTNVPQIPIENVDFLFCYAWNRFEEAQSIPIGGTPSPDLPNLLGRVLLHGARALLRRGLDRNYRDVAEEIPTVRGHINLGTSLRLRAKNVRRIACEFDELSNDLLHNQVIKASLKRLARANSIDPKLAHELVLTAQRMAEVSDIWLERSAFARVQLHRNNAYYDLLLKVAELAFDCLLPDPAAGGFAFHNVLRDETKMARVFEDFVRNFYRAEQREFVVAPLTISWDAIEVSTTGPGRLPTMIVDVYLRSAQRRLIIDTKYYAKALQQSLYGSESFQSANLYQLFSYLKNAAVDPAFGGCEGMLLYPQVGQPLTEIFSIQGHQVTVATVNLDQPWRRVSDALLALLSPPNPIATVSNAA